MDGCSLEVDACLGEDDAAQLRHVLEDCVVMVDATRRGCVSVSAISGRGVYYRATLEDAMLISKLEEVGIEGDPRALGEIVAASLRTRPRVEENESLVTKFEVVLPESRPELALRLSAVEGAVPRECFEDLCRQLGPRPSEVVEKQKEEKKKQRKRTHQEEEDGGVLVLGNAKNFLSSRGRGKRAPGGSTKRQRRVQ